MFIAASIAAITTGRPAASVVPTHNRLVEAYPLLAREIVGWESQRGKDFDRSALHLSPPSGPLKVRLYESDGSFAAGIRFAVVRESEGQPLEVISGTTDEDGSFTIARDLLGERCAVLARGGRVGNLQASDNILTQLRLERLLGAVAPDLNLVKLKDDSTLQLSTLRGQVIYIDFWATWCAPCQKPMAELNHLAREKAEDWKGRVSLLGVSTDQDRSKLEAHLAKKGWNDALQLWVGPDAKPATEAFRVSGLPTAFLIDPEGKVVWTGHPTEIDLEREIKRHLEGTEGD